MAPRYQDYYKILGVNRDATDKEIKAAYRRLARKWHPDLHSGKKKEEAEEKFKQINEAYEVLSDPEKKTKYDRLGSNWRAGDNFQPPPDMDGMHFYTASDFSDFGGFSDFFATLFGGQKKTRGAADFYTSPVRGQDIETEIALTLEEAYRGGNKSIRIKSNASCPECHGWGMINRSFCRRCGGTGTIPEEKSLEVKIPPGVHEG
ncbi:MAG: J domain-containing protein, partial [Syntrophomonadaceae bacterium]|nr:J domain-containing protein [Syntrophomonadaceae bacterium]